jgi:hypothetical protein
VVGGDEGVAIEARKPQFKVPWRTKVVGDDNGHSVEVRGPQFKVPWKNLKVIGYGDDAKDS